MSECKDRFDSLIEFIDYVRNRYGQYNDECQQSIIDAYIEYAKRGLHEHFAAYIKESHRNAFNKCNWEVNVLAKAIAPKLSEEAVETLHQVVKQITQDEDIDCHTGKFELYEYKLITRVCVNEVFGYHVANELGWLVYKELTK